VPDVDADVVFAAEVTLCVLSSSTSIQVVFGTLGLNPILRNLTVLDNEENTT